MVEKTCWVVVSKDGKVNKFNGMHWFAVDEDCQLRHFQRREKLQVSSFDISDRRVEHDGLL